MDLDFVRKVELQRCASSKCILICSMEEHLMTMDSKSAVAVLWG